MEIRIQSKLSFPKKIKKNKNFRTIENGNLYIFLVFS